MLKKLTYSSDWVDLKNFRSRN